MITVRLPEDRVTRMDELVRAESYESRASFIVDAIERLVDEPEQREIDRRIAEGYTRFPQTAGREPLGGDLRSRVDPGEALVKSRRGGWVARPEVARRPHLVLTRDAAIPS